MSPSELYYETAKDTILYQSTLHTEFSSRAFNLLNIGVAALVAGGVILNIRLGSLEWTPLLTSLGVTSLIGFVVVSVLCLSVLKTRDWYAFPPLDVLRDRVESASEDDTDAVRLLIANYMKSGAKENEAALGVKSQAIFLAVLALALEFASTISVVILVFLGAQTTPAGEVPMLLAR